jgi:hypothetical protein
MDTVRSGPTPYRSCSVAESISLPMTALPTTGNPPSAAGTIGNCDRFSVSRNRLRVRFKGSGVRKGHRLRGRRGGIDWNRARPQAGRSQHHGIDWDRLGRSATYRKHAGSDGDRLPGPVMRRPRDGIGQDCLCAAAPRRLRDGIGQDCLCAATPRRPGADIYGDCRRGSTVGRSQGRASEGPAVGGWGRGRGEGAP